MITTRELTAYLDELLELDKFGRDGSNNGLQIEASVEVRKAAFAVDACQEVFQKAAEINADYLFVHHGISWGGSLKTITGIEAKRINTLFKKHISLYAAHLPLDAHPEVGHNATIARRLSLQNVTPFAPYAGSKIGYYGYLPTPVTLRELLTRINEALGTECELLPRSAIKRKGKIQTLGIVSGGAADNLRDAAALNLDAYLTGEYGHQHYHYIKELNVPFIAGGHYNTEVPGVIEVMRRIEKEFNIECEFIDVPTGL